MGRVTIKFRTLLRRRGVNDESSCQGNKDYLKMKSMGKRGMSKAGHNWQEMTDFLLCHTGGAAVWRTINHPEPT